jgi:hypothetical protein
VGRGARRPLQSLVLGDLDHTAAHEEAEAQSYLDQEAQANNLEIQHISEISEAMGAEREQDFFCYSPLTYSPDYYISD